jgi:hypothetical protein
MKFLAVKPELHLSLKLSLFPKACVDAGRIQRGRGFPARRYTHGWHDTGAIRLFWDWIARKRQTNGYCNCRRGLAKIQNKQGYLGAAFEGVAAQGLPHVADDEPRRTPAYSA